MSEDVRKGVLAGHDEATEYGRELVLAVAAWFDGRELVWSVVAWLGYLPGCAVR